MNINDYEDYTYLQDEVNNLRYEVEKHNYENHQLKDYYKRLNDYLCDHELYLNTIEFNVVESFVRKTKLRRINEK